MVHLSFVGGPSFVGGKEQSTLLFSFLFFFWGGTRFWLVLNPNGDQQGAKHFVGPLNLRQTQMLNQGIARIILGTCCPSKTIKPKMAPFFCYDGDNPPSEGFELKSKMPGRGGEGGIRVSDVWKNKTRSTHPQTQTH